MTILTIKNLGLRHPHAAQPALTQVNYTVNTGDFVILLGSNGSGKSTLLKLIQGQLSPDTGQIKFDAQEKQQRPIAALTQNCDDSIFPSLTIYENYLLAKHKTAFLRSKQEKETLATYLSEFNPNLTAKLDIPVSRLSGGEKQALALALCLLETPALLLLDEHTSALDPKTSKQIMELTKKMIERHHITCILTTHDLDIALQYGNRILMLKEGRVHQTWDQEQKNALTKQTILQHYY